MQFLLTVFFSVKLWKQTKNLQKYFRQSNENFRDGRKPETRDLFLVLTSVADSELVSHQFLQAQLNALYALL